MRLFWRIVLELLSCFENSFIIESVMQVFLEREAAKYLERLNEPMKGRILDALEKLANEPPEGNIRKLQGKEAAFRLRVGDCRILFKQKTACLVVYKIAPRGQAYKE